MEYTQIPGAWHNEFSECTNISLRIEELSSHIMELPYDDHLDAHSQQLNIYFKKLEDINCLETLIESLDVTLMQLEEKAKNETLKLIAAEKEVLEDAARIYKYQVAIKECMRSYEEFSNYVGGDKKFELIQGILTIPFSQIFNEETTFFQLLYAAVHLLRRLETVKICLINLIQLEELSNEIETYIETNEEKAFKAYQQLIQWSNMFKKKNSSEIHSFVHLEAFVHEKLYSFWNRIEEKLSRDFSKHFEEIGWPDKIKKEILPNSECFQRFQSSFQTLLIQHQEIIQHFGNKNEHFEYTNTKHFDVLLPFFVMTHPLNIQFQYHFMEKRKTNRIDKPEWFYTYILDTISSFVNFFSTKIQNIINETPGCNRNSLNEFITALLKILKRKIQTSIKFFLMDVHIFSHFIHETIKFDNALQQNFGYLPYNGQWDGIIHIVLGNPQTFMTWVELEKKFSIEQFQNIIDLSVSPDAWDLDYDSLSEVETKPTISSLRIKNLIESITEQYCLLKDFNQKITFFIEIQGNILYNYYERLKCAADAFEITFSRIIQAVSKTKTDEMTQGKKGLKTLCRVYGSCVFIESCLSDWDNDIFFLELWQDLISNMTKNNFPGEITSFKNENILSELNQNSLFDKISSLYFNLQNRIEKLIIRHLEREIKEELRPYFRIYTWSSSENPSYLMAMSCPVSIQMINDLRERFLHLQFLEKQRKKLALSPSSPWSITDSQEARNSSRNRYYDIVPYNKCRVKLIDQENDYINASYISLPNGQRYIAAQGPLRSTVSHFWSMIWHELNDYGIILMLTKIEEQGIEKCAKYWPEEEQEEMIIQKMSLKVEFIQTNYEEDAEAIIHHLKLSKFKDNKLESEKHVYHVYFRDWPDHGVPRDFIPIINLIYLITNMKKKKEDIVLVHCSAGCGRTGTYIVLDYLLSVLSKLKEGVRDENPVFNINKDFIFDIIDHVRKQRMVMVQVLLM
ncbi:hypothetical protein PCK1_002531 [Pneumocystis canis]|nr:hypothetical protein PCK1_002531 [Pneumocystis canis]